MPPLICQAGGYPKSCAHVPHARSRHYPPTYLRVLAVAPCASCPSCDGVIVVNMPHPAILYPAGRHPHRCRRRCRCRTRNVDSTRDDEVTRPCGNGDKEEGDAGVSAPRGQLSTRESEPLLPLDADVTLRSLLAVCTSFQMPKETSARMAKRTMMMMAMTWFRCTMVAVGPRGRGLCLERRETGAGALICLGRGPSGRVVPSREGKPFDWNVPRRDERWGSS